MKHFKLALFAALLTGSTLALAVDGDAAAARERRMDESLQNYRNSAERDPSAGPVARAEESVKHCWRKTGHAIRHGAHRAGHAVRHGMHKTGEAIHRTGEKLEGDSAK